MIAAGIPLRASMHYAMTAEALLEAGSLEDAKKMIVRAQALAVEQSANWCVPEILRIAGLIELRSGNESEAEKLLRRSISEASRIGALTLELRSSLALAEKLDREGSLSESHAVLKVVSGKFAIQGEGGKLI